MKIISLSQIDKTHRIKEAKSLYNLNFETIIKMFDKPFWLSYSEIGKMGYLIVEYCQVYI